MARTVQNLFINGGQTFSITVDGLNPVTEVKLFFDSELVPSSLVRQIITAPAIDYMGPVFNVANFGSKLITDANGSITLEFLYTDSIAKQNFTTDAEYYSFKEFNTGPKTLIIMDAAIAASITAPLSNSLGSTLLTDTLRNARCYAAGVVQLSYDVSFVEIKPSPLSVSAGSSGDQWWDNAYPGAPAGRVDTMSGDTPMWEASVQSVFDKQVAESSWNHAYTWGDDGSSGATSVDPGGVIGSDVGGSYSFI